MKPALNIIVYGKNIFADINNLVKNPPTIEPYSSYENARYFVEGDLNWTYILIQSEYNKKTKNLIEKILKEHYNQKFDVIFFEDKNNSKENKSDRQKEKNILLDCLLICVDNLNDDISKTIFTDIQNYSKLISKQPFVIFLTKKENNPDIEQFWPLITNQFYDRRNLFALKFPSRPEEADKIIEKLNYFYNYYNSRTDTDENKIISNNLLNILIVGQAGAGKSTLQNLLQGEKIAREGEGESVTFRISFYIDKRYNICKIDCPGFESDQTVLYVRNMVKDLRKEMIASKEHIDCVIYLIKSTGDRKFQDMEKEFIKDLIQYEDMDVIFCANTFGKEEDSDDFEKDKEIINDCLESWMEEIENLTENRKEKILENIIYVNLVRKMSKGKILVNIYGIDKLLAKIHELLYPKRIDEIQLGKANDLNELIQIAGKYKLLKMYKERGDFRMKKRITLSKYILSHAKKDFWKNITIIGLFSQTSRRKEMVGVIIKEYEEIKDEADLQKKVEEKYSELEAKLQKINLKEVVNNFFESMKDYQSILEANGFDFSAACYNEYTVAMGLSLMKEYEENTVLFDRNSLKLLKDFARGINSGIQGLKKLSEEWEEILKDIENGKSNIEWVRRFFKLDKKE